MDSGVNYTCSIRHFLKYNIHIMWHLTIFLVRWHRLVTLWRGTANKWRHHVALHWGATSAKTFRKSLFGEDVLNSLWPIVQHPYSCMNFSKYILKILVKWQERLFLETFLSTDFIVYRKWIILPTLKFVTIFLVYCIKQFLWIS